MGAARQNSIHLVFQHQQLTEDLVLLLVLFNCQYSVEVVDSKFFEFWNNIQPCVLALEVGGSLSASRLVSDLLLHICIEDHPKLSVYWKSILTDYQLLHRQQVRKILLENEFRISSVAAFLNEAQLNSSNHWLFFSLLMLGWQLAGWLKNQDEHLQVEIFYW